MSKQEVQQRYAFAGIAAIEDRTWTFTPYVPTKAQRRDHVYGEILRMAVRQPSNLARVESELDRINIHNVMVTLEEVPTWEDGVAGVEYELVFATTMKCTARPQALKHVENCAARFRIVIANNGNNRRSRAQRNRFDRRSARQRQFAFGVNLD